MKTLAFFFAVTLGPTLWAAETVKVASLKIKDYEYLNATITNLDGITARVVHSAGASRIPIELMAPDLRRKLGFDEAAAKAREANKVAWEKLQTEKAAAAAEQERLRLSFPVAIECLAVKKIEGKFRWFFKVRNHHNTAFSDALKITLLTHSTQVAIGHESFQASEPGIAAGATTIVHFDSFTGPAEAHGDSCVEKFICEPIVAGKLSGRSVTDYVPERVTPL